MSQRFASGPEWERLQADCAAFVDGGGGEEDFNRLMLRSFALQYAGSARYRRYCRQIGISPATAANWADTPAVSSFPHRARLRKIHAPEDARKIWMTARTVDLDYTRTPFFPNSQVVAAAARVQRAAARELLFPGTERMKLLFFVPTPAMAPGMVMAAGFRRFAEEFGAPGTRFLISFGGLDLKGFIADLRRAEREGTPLAILGATHGLDCFLDACLEKNVRFSLPPGSRLMESGGFMGRYRRTPPEAFYRKCGAVLGIDAGACVNAFWICESGTVYFDNVLAGSQGGAARERCKVPPPWTRVTVVHPLTLEPVGPGEVGLIRLYDITNIGMACAVQTDKMGYLTAEGFEVVGKLDRSDPAGGIDPEPPHPGGRFASRMMEFMMRRKMARLQAAAAPDGIRGDDGLFS